MSLEEKSPVRRGEKEGGVGHRGCWLLRGRGPREGYLTVMGVEKGRRGGGGSYKYSCAW